LPQEEQKLFSLVSLSTAKTVENFAVNQLQVLAELLI
jgi:hypothetical protein